FALPMLTAGAVFALAQAAQPEPTRPPPASFRMTGAIEKEGDWSAARLAVSFPESFRERSLTYRGKALKARGVPLLDLIKEAGPRVDPARKNHLLAFAALVKGIDGYAVAFSLGELLPENGNRQVYVVTEVDGAPLPEKEAPARLLALDEEKPSR